MSREHTVEQRVLERVRDWLARTLPSIEQVERADLTITLRDTGHRASPGFEVPLVSVTLAETRDAEGFMAPAAALPPAPPPVTEPPPPAQWDAREIAEAVYAASEAGRKLDPLPSRCTTTCAHGSRCMLDGGHVPSDRHATEHGCICYDPPLVGPAEEHTSLHRPGADAEGGP